MYKIPANTLFMGKELVYMPQCQSTNSEAIEMCSKKAVRDGTVIITDHQLGGRGQRGNTWESNEGLNLTFSMILNPTFLKLQDQFLLNVIASLAIADFLLTMGVNPEIKWPNDVIVGGKKISGILVESQVKGEKLTNAIIGIGLNINQPDFGIKTATSLRLITNKEYQLSVLLTAFLEKFEVRYLSLRADKRAQLVAEYEKRMYWKGAEHTFNTEGKDFTGEICGIDAGSGQLCILTENQIMKFGIKQVAYLE